MSPSSHSVHFLARRTCTHDPCRILRSAACGQWYHWLMHVKPFPKTRGTLHLAAIVPMAKAHLQLVKMQPGRDTSALLEGIRCAAATGCAVTGRRFQRSFKDRDQTHAIPWDESRAPFLLLAAILAAGEIQRDVFFSEKSPRRVSNGIFF